MCKTWQFALRSITLLRFYQLKIIFYALVFNNYYCHSCCTDPSNDFCGRKPIKFSAFNCILLTPSKTLYCSITNSHQYVLVCVHSINNNNKICDIYFSVYIRNFSKQCSMNSQHLLKYNIRLVRTQIIHTNI